MQCSDISLHPALASVRYHGDVALKAGILPFRREASGELCFLVAAPKPVRNLEDTVPFAIARGSRRVKDEHGAWQDARTPEALQEALAKGFELEPAQETALAEGEEELGISRTEIMALYDCGILAYKDYGIHFFLAQMHPDSMLRPARDSADVRWLNTQEARTLAQEGRFNSRYLHLLVAAYKSLKN